MKCPDQHRIVMFPNPQTYEVRWGMGIQFQKRFARNCVKCAVIHMKVMFGNLKIVKVG